MTPYQIETLLHIYYTPEPLIQTPILDVTLMRFVADGLISDGKLTEKGTIYVEAILSVPLPVQTWTIPEIIRRTGVERDGMTEWEKVIA